MTLRAENLAVVRGDRTLIEGLNFEVGAGEILHLQGRNGVGKTSLLETLCGLRIPAAGQIAGQPDAAARHWLGHKNALNPMLTPVENLRFWCALHDMGAIDVDTVLTRVGLKAQRHKPCGHLSTGQRRRAALSRLVAAPRPWWFLDEPLAGLDASGLELFAGFLSTHLANGGAAVVTSHQPLPPNIAVRVLTLGGGARNTAGSPMETV